MNINLKRKLMPLMVFLATLVAIAGCSTPSKSTLIPTPTTTPQNQHPFEVISVSGPLQPINPGGAIVEITLKNVGTIPIIALSATLELNKFFVFSYDVTASNPLLPDKTISTKLSLISGGFSDSLSYPLTINATMQNKVTFVYTKQIMIKPSTVSNPEINLAPIHEVKISLMKANPQQVGVYIKGGASRWLYYI